MKIPFNEQYKHPMWQKLRLERLSAANFKCEICSDEETTLHVHHKQYIKGKMLWEYPPENFEVLCEGCHAETHEAKDAINNALVALPSFMWPEVYGILAGWINDKVGSTLSSNDPYHEYIGKFSSIIDSKFDIKTLCDLLEKIKNWKQYESDLNLKIKKRIKNPLFLE